MRPTLTRPVDVRNAWFIWAAFIVAIVAFAWSEGFSHTVTPAYRVGSGNWLAYQPIYDHGDWSGFLYLPTSALVFAPFTLLPHDLGEALWRVTCLVVLAWGVRRASVAVSRTCGVELFPLATLLTLAAVVPAARNGQTTLLITGLMLGAVDATTVRRWWFAGFLLALATVLKPLALVLLLLLGVLRPRLILPTCCFVLLLLALPVLHDGPQKALVDLGDWVSKMSTATTPDPAHRVSDIFGGLVAFDIHVPVSIAYAIRAVAAVGTLALGAIAIRRHGHVRGVLLAGALGFTYYLIFNSRTENNSYGALAPVEATLAAWLLLSQARLFPGVFVAILPFVALSGYEVGKFITPGRETWIAPLTGILFLVVLCVLVFQTASVRSSDRELLRSTDERHAGKDGQGSNAPLGS